jgi:hypothetical protein
MFDNWSDEEFENNKVNIDFINKIETDNDDVSLFYVDIIEMDNTIRPELIPKKLILSKDYLNDKQVLDDFINKLDELSDISFNNADSSKFIFNYGNEITSIDNRMIITKILNGSNLIATNSRIGPANHIVISKENYEKFETSLKTLGNYEIIIYPVDDILLFRKNNADQPGLVYIINNLTNKYDIVDIGFYPYKQCMKIKLIKNED